VTALLLALAAALAVAHSRVVKGVGVLTEAQVRQLAEKIVSSNGFDIDPNMLVAIAWIESNFNTAALRLEPHVGADGDASAGIMQTLSSTAQWLATDFGYRAYAAPSLAELHDPEVSMYFGAAYIDYLKNKRRDLDTEEKIIRGYNGGPAGYRRSATLPYWKKYLDAKARFS